MTETTFGRVPVQVVEILQPLCANTFGSAPCNATGTKCFNTRATCRDSGGLATNFALGTPLSLFFASGKVAERGVPGAPYLIPSLQGVSTAPTRINLAGASADAQGLGNRAVCSITFADHPHSDRRVDPYVDTRGYDPLAQANGSFWTRWLVRNRYRQNVVIKVYEGYEGQALSAMRVRQYFLQEVQTDFPSGRVTIMGKDILTKLEERKAQAPILSPGKLAIDISTGVAPFDVMGAVVGDYPAPGTVRIGEELMTYSAVTAITNGVTLTISARGTDGTVAVAHTGGDAVQWCLRYTAESLTTILTSLLQTYGGIPAAYLDFTQWATELPVYLSLYNLTALITEPTAVTQLVSELQEQALFYLWWDERVAKVQVKAVRGIDEQPPVLSAEKHILQGSFAITEKPRERTSQVWLYYSKADYTKALDDVKSYARQFIVANLETETEELYGEPSIRRVLARWLPSDALAANTAGKIVARYVDVPSECVFRLDARDRGYWIGSTVTISHHMDVDAFGDRRLRNWTIISAEEVIPGEVVEYIAEDTTLYGRIHYVMASGAADYPGPVLAPFKNLYIGNADGLLSDGMPCGRIS
jgi:hypothetical protein